MSTIWIRCFGSGYVLSIVLLFFLTPSYFYASHIVGGDISYQFLSYNSDRTEISYRVTLNLYRDPTGLAFIPEINFGIYLQETNGTWSSYKVVEKVAISDPYDIIPEIDPCKTSFITDNQLKGASYTFDVSLEVSDQSYMIAYQVCCRNFGINNVVSNGDVGAVYDVIITPAAQRNGNTSPQFNTIPSQFVCVNDNMNIDNSASDIDGDSLVYRFCKPKSSGINDNSSADCCGCLAPNPAICTPPYEDLTYINGFSPEEPMGGSPTINVDNLNGFIHGVPEQQGAYVVAVCIEEYRDGILLSTIRRDFQFVVILCQQNLQAKVVADSYSIDPISQKPIACYESCGIKSIRANNQSSDTAFINNYTWEIYDSNDNVVFYLQGQQARDIDISFNEAGRFKGHMIIDDGHTCSDTAFMKFHITEDIDLSFTIDYDTCVARPVEFINSSSPVGIEYNWDFGDGNFSSEYYTTHEYDFRDSYFVSLSAINELGCNDTLTEVLDWIPYELLPPDTIRNDIKLCYHDSIFIYNQWIFSTGIYFDFTPSNRTGCDSIVSEYKVSFTQEILPTIIYDTICENSNFIFQNQIISEAGTFLDTLYSYESCDSIIQLRLEISPTLYFEYEDTYCEGDNYRFNDMVIDNPGMYTDTLISSKKCDSIIILNLSLNEEVETYINKTICENEFLIVDSDTLREDGIYTYGFLDRSLCDSIIIIELKTQPISNTFIVDTLCVGDEYIFDNISLKKGGIYQKILSNQYGCDSIVTLELIEGNNLTRIDIESPIEEYYGNTLLLSPEIIGQELLTYQWYETEEFLSNSLNLEYLLENDSWIFFESENELFCVSIDSIFIKSIINKEIYIPNIFSPNGDGFNDIFYLGASNTLAASELTLYDRWGNLIHKGDKIQDINSNSGWDGTYNDKLVEVGNYTYKFDLWYINGDYEVKTGSIVLLR